MIYKATQIDVPTVSKLAISLWPSHTLTDLSIEFNEILENDDAAVFIAAEHDTPIGFAQCQLRNDYVEGTDSTPVGYLEGIFVLPEYRRQGLAKALLQRCEKWALEKGCAEFASDCEITNQESLHFHLKCGFIEANRIICFTKKL